MDLLTNYVLNRYIFTEFIQLKTYIFFVFHFMSLDPYEMLHTGPLSAAILDAFSSF